MSNTTTLFDSSGVPQPSLLELLAQFQVQHDGTFSGIRAATQIAWLTPGKLRSEISDDDDRAKLQQYIQLFEALGFVEQLTAEGVHAEYMIVGAGKKTAVENRLAFASKQWKEHNMRFRIAVMLGSGRPLQTDEFDPLFQLSNEAQMVCRVYFDAGSAGKLAWEAERGQAFSASHFPFAPKPEDRNASVEDCVAAWLRQFKVQPSPVICVFSQPFVVQQTLAVRLALGPQWANVQGIGYGAVMRYGLRTYLDNIAKQIDVEYRLAHP
jgi:hypothetical protein